MEKIIGKNRFRSLAFLSILALCAFLGGFACSSNTLTEGVPGGGDISGPPVSPITSHSSRAQPETIYPTGDSLPSTDCFIYDSKTGEKRRVPCSAPGAMREKVRYNRIIEHFGLVYIPNLDSKDTNWISRDPEAPNPIPVSEEGPFYFRLERWAIVRDKETGDETLGGVPFDPDKQVRLVVFPSDGSPKRSIDTTVKDLKQSGSPSGGYNVDFPGDERKPKDGDRFEIYLNLKMLDYKDGKPLVPDRTDYNDKWSNLDDLRFEKFYSDPGIAFLGTFRVERPK